MCEFGVFAELAVRRSGGGGRSSRVLVPKKKLDLRGSVFCLGTSVEN